MSYKINVGDVIPDFEAKDSEGEIITRDDILGAPFVLYFYPKDNTPGCTAEACSFRDFMDSFEDMDVLVVGVSPDSPASHQSFAQKHELNFPLLSDEQMTVCKQFDVLREGGKVERTTFICDSDGVIQWIERPVKVDGHIERVIEAVEEYLS